jgi:hypothetical protein
LINWSKRHTNPFHWKRRISPLLGYVKFNGVTNG